MSKFTKWSAGILATAFAAAAFGFATLGNGGHWPPAQPANGGHWPPAQTQGNGGHWPPASEI